VNFEEVRGALDGVPFMTPEQGRLVYRHILDSEAENVLELGTAHGVSAAYMAAALDELGRGRIVTIEREGNEFDPRPSETLARAGLESYVELVRVPHSSYTWWLKDQIADRSDGDGNCDPLYDLCYLDGAHDWTIDGLSAFLVEKLLNPGGWLLVDDLNWSYASGGFAWDPAARSEAEYREPHMRAVFDLIVAQHPSFTEFREQDGSWGWARKAPGQPRSYRLETSRSLPAIVLDRVKRESMKIRSRRA
jgi:predicted O-methyltransferase YrrM